MVTRQQKRPHLSMLWTEEEEREDMVSMWLSELVMSAEISSLSVPLEALSVCPFVKLVSLPVSLRFIRLMLSKLAWEFSFIELIMVGLVTFEGANWLLLPESSGWFELAEDWLKLRFADIELDKFRLSRRLKVSGWAFFRSNWFSCSRREHFSVSDLIWFLRKRISWLTALVKCDLTKS